MKSFFQSRLLGAMVLVATLFTATGCSKSEENIVSQENKGVSKQEEAVTEASNKVSEVINTKLKVLADLASALPFNPAFVEVSCQDNLVQYFVRYTNLNLMRITVDLPCRGMAKEQAIGIQLSIDPDVNEGFLYRYGGNTGPYISIFGLDSPVADPKVFLKVMEEAEFRRRYATQSSVQRSDIQFIKDDGTITLPLKLNVGVVTATTNKIEHPSGAKLEASNPKVERKTVDSSSPTSESFTTDKVNKVISAS